MTMDPSTGPGGLRAALVEPLAEVHPGLPAALGDVVLHSGPDAVLMLMLLEPPRTGSFGSDEQRRPDRLLQSCIGGYGTGSVEADRPSAPTTSVDWQVSPSPELNLALRQLRDDLYLAAAELSLTAPRG